MDKTQIFTTVLLVFHVYLLGMGTVSDNPGKEIGTAVCNLLVWLPLIGRVYNWW